MKKKKKEKKRKKKERIYETCMYFDCTKFSGDEFFLRREVRHPFIIWQWESIFCVATLLTGNFHVNDKYDKKDHRNGCGLIT